MRINHPSLNSSLREKTIHYERKNKKPELTANFGRRGLGNRPGNDRRNRFG